MEINLQNIEDQIFFNKKIQALLPEFRHYFEQWQLSKVYPGFGNLGAKSVVDFLNSLETKHLLILEKYFGTPVLLNKIDPHIVRHYQAPVDDAQNLCEFSGYHDFCLFRNKDQIKMTFWR